MNLPMKSSRCRRLESCVCWRADLLTIFFLNQLRQDTRPLNICTVSAPQLFSVSCLGAHTYIRVRQEVWKRRLRVACALKNSRRAALSWQGTNDKHRSLREGLTKIKFKPRARQQFFFPSLFLTLVFFFSSLERVYETFIPPLSFSQRKTYVNHLIMTQTHTRCVSLKRITILVDFHFFFRSNCFWDQNGVFIKGKYLWAWLSRIINLVVQICFPKLFN